MVVHNILLGYVNLYQRIKTFWCLKARTLCSKRKQARNREKSFFNNIASEQKWTWNNHSQFLSCQISAVPDSIVPEFRDFSTWLFFFAKLARLHDSVEITSNLYLGPLCDFKEYYIFRMTPPESGNLHLKALSAETAW